MKAEEIFKKYPKSIELVKKWYLEKILESSGSQEFVDQISKNIDAIITTMIDASPRTLFDLFDSYGLFIEITIANDLTFEYKIYSSDIAYKNFYGRQYAEKDAILNAFILLEEMLENNKKD